MSTLEINGLTVEPIIGLEIHVQLCTRSKLFCGCAVQPDAAPNTNVCPTCLGLPGALPAVNEQALELAVRAGLALNCQIATRVRWDRKHYFYPDLPRNYQVTQYHEPIARDGYFEFPHDERFVRVRIQRAHLEEDAGKNVHDLPAGTGVDLNRAGTPLLEIVTAPDLTSAEAAVEFAIQIHRLVRYLGVSGANMQAGQLRFEPNINCRISHDGQVFTTPIVEVKNLNSFRALGGTIDFELHRQVTEWQHTGEVAAVGNKTNRGWDDRLGQTVAQRGKEEARDYRYLPEPDLPPMRLGRPWVADLKERMPELPTCRTERLISEYTIARDKATALVTDRATADLLDEAAHAGGDKTTLAHHFLGFWSQHAHQRGSTIAGLRITPARLAGLANLVATGRITATSAGQLAVAMLNSQEDPATLADELGLYLISDAQQIDTWVDETLAEHRQAVDDALNNRRKLNAARGFLLGQVVRRSGGRADPGLVSQALDRKLAALRESSDR